MSAVWGNYNARTSGGRVQTGAQTPFSVRGRRARGTPWSRAGLAQARRVSGSLGEASPRPGHRGEREEREAEAQRLQGGPCLRPGRHPKCSGRGFQKEVTASLEAPVGARGNDGCSSPP